MLEIDGSQGEGGGQVIRSSLALSAITGQAIQLSNIRAGRSKPGLLRQHLTGVQAAAEVCGAEVSGAELGANSITFEPGKIRGGDFEFRISTAGSTSLVAQTVLPALMLADEPSTLTLEGGTHNPGAPPFDFLQRTFLPQLAKAGPRVKAEIQRYGFYPSGGGRVRFSLVEPCEKFEPRVTAVVAGIPVSVGERECETIRRKANWHSSCFLVHDVEEPIGAGNVVMIELVAPMVTELLIGIGKVGVKAEHVARTVLRSARSHIKARAPVGEYLADQLMMPMGLAASQGKTSSFLTSPLSTHSKTHIDVLKMFLDIQVNVERTDDANCLVSFSPVKK
jgi:RNA 3'-terminal phosphate cyclase (ATP)